jgi:hypothetical protein
MADATFTVRLAREDVDAIDTLLREVRALRAQLAGEPTHCPNLQRVLVAVRPDGAVWEDRCVVRDWSAPVAPGACCGQATFSAPAAATRAASEAAPR